MQRLDRRRLSILFEALVVAERAVLRQHASDGDFGELAAGEVVGIDP